MGPLLGHNLGKIDLLNAQTLYRVWLIIAGQVYKESATDLGTERGLVRSLDFGQACWKNEVELTDLRSNGFRNYGATNGTTLSNVCVYTDI